jgi:hypothetical protein
MVTERRSQHQKTHHVLNGLLLKDTSFRQSKKMALLKEMRFNGIQTVPRFKYARHHSWTRSTSHGCPEQILDMSEAKRSPSSRDVVPVVTLIE